MNLAKEVYFDENGDMIRNTRYENKDKFITTQNVVFTGTLRLVNVGWQNSGAYFILQDNNEKVYYMSWEKFIECINKHSVEFNDDFTFYQQGSVRSIGLANSTL